MPVPNHYLRRERQLKGWSQVYLAKQIEVPDYYISRWERGEVTPSPYYQQKLCDLFGKTAEDLGFLQPADPSFFAAAADLDEQAPTDLISSGQAPTDLTSSGQAPSITMSAQNQGSVGSGAGSSVSAVVPPVQFASRIFSLLSRYRRLHPFTVIVLSVSVGVIIGAIIFSLLLYGLPAFSAHQQPPSLYSTATSGTSALSDTMAAPDSNQWDNVPNSCVFQAGDYHVLDTHPGTFSICREEANTFCNFAFQADMTIITGDGGGLIFRLADGTMERFRVSSNGSYDLVDTSPNIGPYGASSAIHQGLGKSNVLTSIAQGSTIDIYVNGQHIGNLQHSKSPACGQIGFLALDFTQSADVQFSNVKVWNLD